MAEQAVFEGLSEAEAGRRLLAEGPNELAAAPRRTIVTALLHGAREPMQMLMLGAAILYLLLGDVMEGLFLVAAATVAMGLVVLQEVRSENALAALRDLSRPLSRVIRGGAERAIPNRELVRGDAILIGEGDRLPADALLVSGDAVVVDESVLTGESAPVVKLRVGDSPEPVGPLGDDDSDILFGGTLIVRGQGLARVIRTGARSSLGRISAALARIEPEATPLQQDARQIVAMLGMAAIGFCLLIAVAYGLLRHEWAAGALAGITVAIALVPEEFPMVLAVFLALGAWRLATHRVLVRRSAVIESLGAASILCVDKTGTLTENRMRVARLWSGTVASPVDGGAAANALRRAAMLASALHAIDPMDRALHELQSVPVLKPADFCRSWPLTRERMAFVQAWRVGEGFEIAAKGAPEAIFRLCGLQGPARAEAEAAVGAFAREGMRVLGVASATAPAIPDDPGTAEFRFLGLIGFVDPLRSDVAAALQEALRAGVKVAMVTGDHPATAEAIAREAGIETEPGVLLGEEAAQLPLPTLCERLKTVRVFARVAPEQKLLLVEALKAEGEIVAMTGDGVNDAPALEAAHIGIAMGKRGTDVAREAADLVLLDDSFASIVRGVRLGRRIFSNLRNALTYITAIHVPIAGLALAPVLLGWPPLLLPMHVVLLELAIDPVCALVFEAERSDQEAMMHPPRRRGQALFGPEQIQIALAQGAGLLAAVLALYAYGLGHAEENAARGAAFLALALGNLAIVLADSVVTGGLFAEHRRIFWGIAGAVCTALVLVFTVAPLRAMFGVLPPSPGLTALAFVAVATSGGWAVLLRRWRPM